MRKLLLIIFMLFIVLVKKSHSRRDDRKQHHYDSVKIGGLFEDARDAERAFKFAVKRTSEQNDENLRKLHAISQNISAGDTYFAAQSVCEMIEKGALGIIGPVSASSAMHVNNICDNKEIPVIETRVDGTLKHVISLHPTPLDISKVVLDLINVKDWRGFTILYEDAPWLVMVDYLMNNYNKSFTIAVKELDVSSIGNYRSRLLQVKKSGDKNIVISCSIESLPEVLKQAQQVGLITDDYHFIITSLDMHTLDLDAFHHGGANITGIRMVNPNSNEMKEFTEYISAFNRESMKSKDLYGRSYEQNEFENDDDDDDGLTPERMRVNTALTYDAVMLFSKVMNMHHSITLETPIRCNNQDSIFLNGTSIFNSMKTVSTFFGLSGRVQFNQLGNRENFELEIFELASDGIKIVGTWESVTGLKLIVEEKHEPKEVIDIFKQRPLKILTKIKNAPYAMIKNTTLVLKGNNQYEGYVIELIEKLATRIGFNYTFIDQPSFGRFNEETKNWDGMMGDLMNDRADLAIADLTITSERESIVDFTMPFMGLGIQILFQKPVKEDPELFSFLSPFSDGVWACVIGSFFLVSFSLFIMGRMSPQEWDNPFACIEEPEVLYNQFNIKNSIWFTVGAVLQQGSEIAPKAPSTRIVASIWWFFTLIMVSSYTANLAAFLTIEKPVPIITGLADMYSNTISKKISGFGAMAGGSTESFFKESDMDLYKKIAEYMTKNPEMMIGKEEGLEKAKTEKYAYISESSTIEYYEQRHCTIAHVGDKLDEKGYGIAMKKDSPYRNELNLAILHLQESGDLTRLKDKWWKEKYGGGACSVDDSSGGATELNMKNVGGIFVTVCIGCGFAILIGVTQWILNIRKMSKRFEISFSEALKSELQFFRQFSVHVKPVQRKSSSEMGSINSEFPSQSRKRSRSVGTNKEQYKISLKSLNKGHEEDGFS